MENNQESSVISNVPITPKTNNSLLIVMIGLLLLLLMGLGVLIVVVLKSQSTSDKPVIIPEKISPTIQKEEPTSIPTPISKVGNIAYIKDNNIYVMGTDGLNKKKLTNNADSSINISNIGWKNSQNLTYSKCKNGCVLTTFNLESNIEKIEANPGEFAGETQISTFSWNHKGDMIAFIYRLPDGKERLAFKSGTVQTTIKEFKQALGRGGGFDDNVNIEFSPDDGKVLVTNTGQLPNAENDSSSIWVFDVSGKELMSVNSSEHTATQATWIDNYEFLYKYGNYFYQKTYTHPESQTVSTPFGNNLYNPKPSFYNKYLATWKIDKDLKHPTTIIYPWEDKPLKEYKDTIMPTWLTDKLLLLKNTSPSNDEGMINFTTSGLSIINIEDNSQKRLEYGNITYFAVQP